MKNRLKKFKEAYANFAKAEGLHTAFAELVKAGRKPSKRGFSEIVTDVVEYQFSPKDEGEEAELVDVGMGVVTSDFDRFAEEFRNRSNLVFGIADDLIEEIEAIRKELGVDLVEVYSVKMSRIGGKLLW